MKEYEQELGSLPPLVMTDLQLHMSHLLFAFVHRITEHVHGSTRLKVLVQKNNEAYNKFKLAMACTAPCFLLFESAPDDPSPYVDKDDSRPRMPVKTLGLTLNRTLCTLSSAHPST